jgi:hypothetical protein
MKEFSTRSRNKTNSQKELRCHMNNASYTVIKARLLVPPVIAVFGLEHKSPDSWKVKPLPTQNYFDPNTRSRHTL